MRLAISLAAVLAVGCGSAPPRASTTPTVVDRDADDTPGVDAPPKATCGGEELRVAFYNAGQALAALVTLPDGQHVLVDTGESPTRAGLREAVQGVAPARARRFGAGCGRRPA